MYFVLVKVIKLTIKAKFSPFNTFRNLTENGLLLKISRNINLPKEDLFLENFSEKLGWKSDYRTLFS